MWTVREVTSCTVIFLALMVQAAIVCFASVALLVCVRPFSRNKHQEHQTLILGYWAQSLFGLVQLLAPSNLILYFDESCPPSSIMSTNDKADAYHSKPLSFDFPDRTIVIANHQIYADWIFVWFIAYLAQAHGQLKIMLKNSLKFLPFFGFGMYLMDFIFMKRKLVNDKNTVIKNLKRSLHGNKPMWLLLFPEGTVICDDARERSKAFAAKNNMDDTLFTLLPRATGLKLCVETLGDSVEWVYDLTLGYPGILPGQIPEDTLRLKQIFTGKGPKDIHVHLRRYHRSELPLQDADMFSKWLLDRWVEKDKRMEQFYDEGRFTSFDHGDDSDDHAWINDGSPLMGAMEGAHTIRMPIALHSPFREFFGLWIYMLPYVPLVYILYRAAYYLAH
ncbi:acyltransferase-domain-containing protein [Gongronella butleri]|nr:acyltransferase-domain-containing protein [Gongronella butleri]